MIYHPQPLTSPSLPLWFCLVSRWRKEAVPLLTKAWKTQRRVVKLRAARQKSSRAGCNETKRSHRQSQMKKRTQSDVKGQENPGLASGDRLFFQGSTRNSQVTEPGASDLEGYDWTNESQYLPMRKHGETDCSLF